MIVHGENATQGGIRRRRWRPRWRHVALLVLLGMAVGFGVVWVETLRLDAKRAAFKAEQEARKKQEPWGYDLDACATDAEGMFHVALGRIVLRVPEGTTLMTDRIAVRDPERLIPPPDPNEPEGCPGNPSQQGSLGFMYRYAALLENKFDPNLTGQPNQLQLISARPDFWGTWQTTEG